MDDSRVNTVSFRFFILSFGALLWCLSASATEISVSFSEEVHSEAFTGRIYIMFSARAAKPASGPGWFAPEPFVSRDVVGLEPGDSVTFETSNPEGWLTYPRQWNAASVQQMRAQAVIRFNSWERTIGRAPGNGVSPVSKPLADEKATVSLDVKTRNPNRAFRETRWTKQLEVNSPLLGKFHGRAVPVQAAVILPASYYDQPTRRYPVIFTIPGFGGTHWGASREAPITETNESGVEFVRVLLDPSCPLGHHVFADSANNGPWGTALVTEFIPALERTFRVIPQPTARFVTGHSSGGWSSLWLQVAYPKVFGGTWSTAPDPVDFQDFQRINVYRPGENMYRTPSGERRPLARRGETPVLWYDGFAWMEWVLGPGGQLHSFEAVFSEKGPDNRPKLLWNRETGEIDQTVGLSWQKYDIRRILETDWNRLKPNLSGKLHVFMGDIDTFYLEGATIRLKKTLEQLGSDAVVEIHPGKDHSSLMTRELRDRIRKEMVSQFLKNHSVSDE